MNFPNISYDKWLEKVKKELKVDSLESHFVEVGTVLRTNPFFERIPESGTFSREEKSWNVSQKFHAKKVSNADILRSLEGGVNYVEILQAESLSDLKYLLEKVELDYIHLHLSFSIGVALDKVKNLLGSYMNNPNISYHIDNSTQYLPQCKFRFASGLEGNTVEDLSRICEEIISIIDAGKDQEEIRLRASNIEFERFISSDIIQEIAYHSAIKLLWENILHGFDLGDIELETFASCLPPENLNLEKKYIAQSSKGLTSIIAGYTTVYIAPASDNRKEFHDRISRNIHHLLYSESFIHKSSNGMKGSFQIQRIATELASTVWKKIGRI